MTEGPEPWWLRDGDQCDLHWGGKIDGVETRAVHPCPFCARAEVANAKARAVMKPRISRTTRKKLSAASTKRVAATKKTQQPRAKAKTAEEKAQGVADRRPPA
jgi:hypothetical protein